MNSAEPDVSEDGSANLPARKIGSPSSETEFHFGWRRRFFRIAAIVFGLSVFPVAETLLAMLNVSPPSAADDPFVGFAGIRPLFEASADGLHMHTSPARRGFFEEDQFLKTKPNDEFRIFVFGGSTVQGNPYSIQTSFTQFLQIALNHAAPSTTWKVVNCGGISYASYRLIPIMEECLQYQPDLMIVCTGHNEFLEDVSYSEIKETSSAVSRLYSVAGRFRTYRALRDLLTSDSANAVGQSRLKSGSRPTLSMEADALLDHQGGLEAYQRDDRHARHVESHFRSNLYRMKRVCIEAGLPMLLIHPPSNLRDCPPFKADFDDGLPEHQRAQVRKHLSDASEKMRNDAAAAANLLQQAAEIDPRFAFTWYQLGHAWLAGNEYQKARESFTRARDEDLCPLRMTSELEAVMSDMAEATQTDFIDAAALLEPHCTNGIIGDNVLVDHIHPSFRAHQWIALEIADWMIMKGLLNSESKAWRIEIDQQFAEHLQSLDNMYFLKGRRRLRDLQGWAAGRAEGPPVVRRPRDRAFPE